MAEVATIARPYAEALFKAAAADLAGAASWLDELAVIAGDPQLLAFADNPKINAAQVRELVAGLVRQPLSQQAVNFLGAVIDNGRLAALPEIAAQFRALKNAAGGTSDAVVQSPYPIEGATLGELGQVLEKRFGRKLNVKVELTPDLIAGVRVVVGDEVLDTSVKARLEQMKVALTA